MSALPKKKNSHIFHDGYHLHSAESEVFCKKGAPKNFAKFTGNYLCLGVQLYLKRDSNTGVFLWIFAKFLGTVFVYRTPLVATSDYVSKTEIFVGLMNQF